MCGGSGMKKNGTSDEASSSSSLMECDDILVIPRQWTKRAYQILVEFESVPRPWHLEGRWGSRTHRFDETAMAFPITSSGRIQEQAAKFPQVQQMLREDGIQVLKGQPFVTSRRARNPEYFDATIHPERERPYQAPSECPFPNDKKPALFTYCELFAGIGGFGVALEALGGTCVFCSELEESCRDTYKANFNTPNDHIHGDIYQVQDSAFPAPGTLDLLVGGFPCQPFSNMSSQPGMNCEKGRGLLFLQIVRTLELSRPKAFLLENVPGLFDMTDTYEYILEVFQSTGYIVTTEVCSSRGLTATSRKRLFFVGLRPDLASPGAHEGPVPFEFPYVPDLQLKAEHILDYDHLPEEELEILRLGDSTMDQLVNGKRWRPHRLAWPNRPCDTITSHYGNAVGRGESQLVPSRAPRNPRRFSIRECARLMGFPNTYRITDPGPVQGDMAYRKLHYRMFGNAVCPPLITVLAGAVLNRCHLQCPEEDTIDWVQQGLQTAVALAMSAKRPGDIVLPMGCLVLEGDPKDAMA